MFLKWHHILFGLSMLALAIWGAMAIITFGFSTKINPFMEFGPPVGSVILFVMGVTASALNQMDPSLRLKDKIKKLTGESKMLLAGILLICIGGLVAGLLGEQQVFMSVGGLGLTLVILSLFMGKNMSDQQPQKVISPGSMTEINQSTALTSPSPTLKNARIVIIVAAAILLVLTLIITAYLITTGRFFDGYNF